MTCPKRPPFAALRSATNDGQNILDSLRRPVVASRFSPTAVTLVLAMRLAAHSVERRSDPLVDLAPRLGSFTAARAVMDFARGCSLAWPENAMVARPCCHALTPDETAFAQMAETARHADRAAFTAVLDGLIRRERHERLFTVTQRAVAEIAATRAAA